ncbi:hypothetical protein CHU98_g1078 [Xylaria longipes]|nr:hypothetical protein CHU98_g1078 [Xylaria longipes]
MVICYHSNYSRNIPRQITALLAVGNEPALKDTYGRTPLSYAVERGHEAVVMLLLANHVVNPESKLLELCPGQQRTGMTQWLSSCSIKQKSIPTPRIEYGRTPLSWAAERGHKAVVEALLTKNKVDIPLWYAAEIGHEAIAKLLLGDGVDPNSKSEFGRTPLSYAAEKGHEAIVKLLLGNSKVGPDFKDCEYERTPLSWAAANGHEDVVKLLLQENKVDPNSKSKYGRTPLSWAARFGHEAAVRLLLSKDKVDSDSKCDYQRTPLSYAAERGHETIVKLLLERGEVDPSSTDSEYRRTPLLWARVNGHETIVKLLKESCQRPANHVNTGLRTTTGDRIAA